MKMALNSQLDSDSLASLASVAFEQIMILILETESLPEA